MLKDDIALAKALLDHWGEDLHTGQHLLDDVKEIQEMNELNSQIKKLDKKKDAEKIEKLRTQVSELQEKVEKTQEWTWALTDRKFSEKLSTSLLLKYKKGGESKTEYWLDRGEQVLKFLTKDKGVSLRCADSAALIVYLLAGKDKFGSNLGVIRQGNPAHEGHWFVVAGDLTGLDLTFPLNKNKKDKVFVIDVWGEILMRERGKAYKTVVMSPPACFFTVGEDKDKLVLACTIDRSLAK